MFDDLRVRLILDGDLSPYARGTGLGGSSSVNAMVGVWGIPDDYDRWERDHGLCWLELGHCRAVVSPPGRATDTDSAERMGKR